MVLTRMIWNKSLEDLKKHHFSISAYVVFIIALEGRYKAILQSIPYLDPFALSMGALMSGLVTLVIILYFILYKQTKVGVQRLFLQEKRDYKTKRILGTVTIIIIGLYVSYTFLLSYRLAHIHQLKYSRTYFDYFTLFMGSFVLGLIIILDKMIKGEVLNPFFLRTSERIRERAIGAVMLVILGLYFLCVFLFYPRLNLSQKVEQKILLGLFFAPLIEEFIFRVLLPYAFLLGLVRISRFAKKEIWGFPLLLVASQIFSALIFASAHWRWFQYGITFPLFVRFFSFGIFYSCVFLLFLSLSDSTTGYAGAVLAHGLSNWVLIFKVLGS